MESKCKINFYGLKQTTTGEIFSIHNRIVRFVGYAEGQIRISAYYHVNYAISLAVDMHGSSFWP